MRDTPITIELKDGGLDTSGEHILTTRDHIDCDGGVQAGDYLLFKGIRYVVQKIACGSWLAAIHVKPLYDTADSHA